MFFKQSFLCRVDFLVRGATRGESELPLKAGLALSCIKRLVNGVASEPDGTGLGLEALEGRTRDSSSSGERLEVLHPPWTSGSSSLRCLLRGLPRDRAGLGMGSYYVCKHLDLN